MMAFISSRKKALASQTVLTLSFSLFHILLYTDVFSVVILQPLRNRFRKALNPTNEPSNSALLKFLTAVRWTSNIPGTPDSMDTLSQCISGPFPTVVDYNACMPSLSLPVVLVGRPPVGVRYWSIQIYLLGDASVFSDRDGSSPSDSVINRSNQTLIDADIRVDDDGCYRVVIGSADAIAKHGEVANCINSYDSKAGLLVIRSFKLPSGSTWLAPSLYDAAAYSLAAEHRQSRGAEHRDDKHTVHPYLTKHGVRRSGEWSSVCSATSDFNRLKTCVAASVAMGVSACVYDHVAPRVMPSMVPSMAHTVMKPLLTSSIVAPWLHGRILNKLSRKWCRVKHPPGSVVNESVIKVPGLGGNSDHIYYNINYDVKKCDIAVSGVSRCVVEGKEGWRYINVTGYEYKGTPYGEYYDTDNITPCDVNSEGQERYTIYVTTKKVWKGNEIQVRESKGMVTVRILLPSCDKAAENSVPTVRVVERGWRE
jgi:hypothetical protein